MSAKMSDTILDDVHGPAGSIDAYADTGFAVARGLLSPDEVETIRQTFMQANEHGPVEGLSEIKRAGEGYDPTDPLAFYPRMMHPHKHPDKPVGRVAMRYMLDPRIGRVLRRLLGDEPIAAQSMFYFKPPGARGQAMHQDNFYLRVRPGTCIAAWCAIDDADEGNGGMVVVPGSDKLDLICPEQADTRRYFTTEHIPTPAGMTEQPVRLKAGDVLFFNGSLIHGSTPNSSADRFRRSLIFHYVPQSCSEVGQWYRPLYRFDGTTVERDQSLMSGPCGTAPEFVAPH